MILLTGDRLLTIVGHIYIYMYCETGPPQCGGAPTFISPIQGSLQAKLDSGGGGNIFQMAMESERCTGNCNSNCRLTLTGANVTIFEFESSPAGLD